MVRSAPIPVYDFQVPVHNNYIAAGVVNHNCGKTMGGAVETVGRAMGQHPLFTDVKYEGPQNIWVGANPKFVHKLFRVLVAMCPPSAVTRVYWSKGDERIEFNNGSTITMKSFGMDRNEWQMEEVNFLWLDEEFPEELWEEMIARLNAPDSQCLITCSMVESSTHLFELTGDFCEEAKNNPDGYQIEYSDGHKGPRVSWFSAKMRDNPLLPEDYIHSMEHACRKRPEMFKIRILGIPTPLAGLRIFKEVLPDIKKHLRPPTSHWWFSDRGEPITRDQNDPLVVDVYERPKPHLRYVIGADLAEGGVTGDYTTCHVICVDSSSVVAKFQGHIEPGPFGRILAYLGWWYNTAVVNWEFNMQGSAVKDRLTQMRYRNMARRQSFSGKIDPTLSQYGFRTGAESKHAIINDLRDSLGDGVLVMPDNETYDELGHFGHLKDKGGNSRRLARLGVLPPGEHDDLVMSLAITWYTTRLAQPAKHGKYHPLSLGEALYEEWEKEQKRKKRKRIGRMGVLP